MDLPRRQILAALLGAPRALAATFAYADRPQALADVQLPASPRGAVLLVHGGGFVGGSREMPAIARAAEALVEAGLAAVSVDYRLLGRGGGFEEALEDVVAAARWWRTVAPSHGVPDRLGLLGLSAGAALAAVAAAEAHAWVGVYGPYDFRRLPGQPTVPGPTRWLLGTTDPAALWAASPLARAIAPIPTLLYHGTRDRLVPLAHAEALVAARERAGLPVELRRVDAGHGYLQRPASPAARETMEGVISFFARHL